VGQHRYELFEFINGKTYDHSLEATGQSGRMLAVFHQLMRHYDYAADSFDPPTAGYHRADAVARAFRALPTTRWAPAASSCRPRPIKPPTPPTPRA